MTWKTTATLAALAPFGVLWLAFFAYESARLVAELRSVK
jgi:hypothetical protein